MAQVITSFSPSTGPTTGGTIVSITGTGLDVTDAVFFGSTYTPVLSHTGSTGLSVRAPKVASAGAVNLHVVDAATDASVASSTQFTYTSASAPVYRGTLNRDWRAEVSTDSGSSWTLIYGMNAFTPAIENTDQDDSDFLTNGWRQTGTTMRAWTLPMTLSRKQDQSTLLPDPGQELLRAAADDRSVLLFRWYKNIAGWEAYSGSGTVDWSPQGGGVDGFDLVAVTVNGQTERTAITNPAGA
jgi:hypothetical protein